MGIGQKIVNETVDIAASLAKRALNDSYSIGKLLVKNAFKTTFKVAKYTTKFSYQVIKHFSKKAMEYHQEKKLTKQKIMNAQQTPLENKSKYNQYFQQQPTVQKQNNVVYANQFQEQDKKIFQERRLHTQQFQNIEKFHFDMLDSGMLDQQREKDVKKILGLMREERKMLDGNKIYKNSEYYANHDYVNNSSAGMKKGVKQAVQTGNIKEFQEEYKEKYQIARADISGYFQKIEKTTNIEEKAFWTNRLENYVDTHQKTLRENGLGKSIEGIKPNNTALTKTEKIEAKLKKLEDLKKGMKLTDKIQQKTATMENSRMKLVLEARNAPRFEDMFLKNDKERQDFRESQKRLAAERKAHAEREIYF
ncbi:hypothetical protein bcgnr5412_55440 [Bacillus cereus]